MVIKSGSEWGRPYDGGCPERVATTDRQIGELVEALDAAPRYAHHNLKHAALFLCFLELAIDVRDDAACARPNNGICLNYLAWVRYFPP